MRRASPILLALATGGCAVLDQGFLNAAGPVADHERTLFVTVAIVLIFVVTPVLLLAPLFAWHYRLANTRHAYRPHWGFSWWVEGLIWIPPVAIVVGLSVLLWRWTIIDDPYRPLPGGPPLEVEAVALDWKWLFLYPGAGPGGRGIATVDRLVIPAGRPVHLRLTSGTVMQSFMVPRLAGQIYAMAGMTTQLNLAAHRPGRYAGRNTQFDGDGFARARFEVVALPPAAYTAWTARAATTPGRLDAAALARLDRRALPTGPAVFGDVPAGLFDRIVAAHGGTGHHQMAAPR